jgi:hypothetical protein
VSERSYGASADQVTAALIDLARRYPDAWWRWDDLCVRAGYQSIGNALRHAARQGRIERKKDPKGSNRSLWRFNRARMEANRA